MSNRKSTKTITPVSRIGFKHQITIPKEVFKRLNLEVGDFIIFEIKKEEAVLKPKKLIPKDQEWFWAPEWQKKEKEAEEDLKKGRYKVFKNIKELLKDLHS